MQSGVQSNKSEDHGVSHKPSIVFFLPSFSVGGAERHTVDLCRRIRDRGFSARILVHGRARSDAMLAQPGSENAVFLNLKGMSDFSGWVKVWKVLRELQPDIVVTVNQTPLIISVIERFLFATRAKIACIFHTTNMQAFESYQQNLFNLAARVTDLLVYVGENQQRVWEARGIRPRRAALIRNGIETSRFVAAATHGEATRSKLGLATTDYVVGIVAAFRAEKNHVELVKALALARKACPSVKLLCVGDGGTRAAVAGLAAELGVSDQVLFAGEQSDVAPFIAASDVGVLCSTSETFPLSAIEFLAVGRPMIAANVGGAGEIVKDGLNGRLYPLGHIQGLADAIVELSDPARRAELAASAQASVASFSADVMADTYAAAFNDLIRGRK